jgi:V/A-type H+-transporting ATPase subunit E
MNADEQVTALEQAIRERAQALADEHMAQAERARQRIHRDSEERLRLLEERETLLAQSRAEREYRRRVQAAEIRMQADLDRLRWGLVEGVMDGLRRRLEDLRADDDRYLPLFTALLAEAAAAVERDELEALVSDQDQGRIRRHWETIAAGVPEGKDIVLSDEPCTCGGGVLVRSRDRRISVDNTFEGRMERMREELHRVVLERLFPAAAHMGALFNG